MISLSANTSRKIYASKDELLLIVTSDSGTVTRLTKNARDLEDSTTSGYGLTCYTPVVVRMHPGDELYAVSTGTPNLSVFEQTSDFKAGF